MEFGLCSFEKFLLMSFFLLGAVLILSSVLDFRSFTKLLVLSQNKHNGSFDHLLFKLTTSNDISNVFNKIHLKQTLENNENPILLAYTANAIL